MEIKIAPEVIENAATAAVQRGIEEGMRDYTIKAAIAEATTAAFKDSDIVAICRRAVEAQVTAQAEAVAQAVAATVGPAVAKVMTESYLSVATGMLVELRVGGRYVSDEEKRMLRAEVRKELGL